MTEAMVNRHSREQATRDARSLGRDAWRRLSRNRMARLGGLLFGCIALLCFVGPLFLQQSYETTRLAYGAQPPSLEHWFGTDELGRDLFVRTLVGGRISLLVGFAATAVALCIGVAYGLLAGYVGGRLESLMMRLVDTLYALPFTIIVILLTVFLGRSITLIFLAIGAVEWLTMARIVRGETRSLKRLAFVDAARAGGVPNARIMRRHILPNLLSPVIVFSTLTIPAVILLESVISFLGLGVQPPMSSWGMLINEGARNLDIYPWLLIFPAVFFSLTLFSLNFIGDGLRDALDPRERD